MSENNHIIESARALLEGEVVAFPTETVYGLGANAYSDAAVQKIFTLKLRPANNPLIVHISSIDNIESAAYIGRNKLITNRLEKLSYFWPGPLSVVLPKNQLISSLVTAGQDTVAVRVPLHPIALQLIKEANLPIAAPSANISEYISPTSAEHVREAFAEKVKYILDGGNCEVGIESTVISIVNDKPILLRPGYITKEQLEQRLGEEIEAGSKTTLTEKNIFISPGMFPKHYSPVTPIKFIDSLNKEDIVNKNLAVVKLFQGSSTPDFIRDINHRIYIISKNNSLDEVAHNLYFLLRSIDKEKFDLIAIEQCNKSGVGVAIMDRLERAVAL